MAEKKTFMANSLEDAITAATMSLGITSDRLEYEVIDKGSKGFLGLGYRQTIIEAWIKTEEKEAEVKVEVVKAEVKKPEFKKAVETVKAEEKVKTNENDAAHFEEGKKFLNEVFEKMDMKVNIEYKYNADKKELAKVFAGYVFLKSSIKVLLAQVSIASLFGSS